MALTDRLSVDRTIRRSERVDLAIAALKFLVASLIGNAAWAIILIIVLALQEWPWTVAMLPELSELGPLAEDMGRWLAETDNALMVTLVVVSVLPAIIAHRLAPSEYVDGFHRLGAAFAMFLPINLVLTVGFLAHQVHFGYIDTYIGELMVYAVLSSLFLPGPYFGALAGSRWAR